MARNAIGTTIATASLLGGRPCDTVEACADVVVFGAAVMVAMKGVELVKVIGAVVDKGAVSVSSPPGVSVVPVGAAASCEGDPAD